MPPENAPPNPNDCTHKIVPPLQEPYRTGSYLIYDYPLGSPTNFREGTKIDLRASGSHQLDAGIFGEMLKPVAIKVKPAGELHIVDLRQESHVFFDDRAVSWYADSDWANVGWWRQWILNDEANRIKSLWERPGANTVQIFCITKNAQEQDRVIPTGYSNVTVRSAHSEESIVENMRVPCRVAYHRIPVTDHCAPESEAQRQIAELCWKLYRTPDDLAWVHFHCHGGDGRTTTFLAMYDMVCWAKSRKAPLLTVEQFAERQCNIFPYCLNPKGCSDKNCKGDAGGWKHSLGEVRWQWLIFWHDWIARGGLAKDPLEWKDFRVTA